MGTLPEEEEFGEAEYMLRFPSADTAAFVQRELREKGYEVEVVRSASEESWELHVRWKGWRSARAARHEPCWMRRVAAYNGGTLLTG
jgi:hypothetical protein